MKDSLSPVQTEEVKETGYKKIAGEREIAGDQQRRLSCLRNMFDHTQKKLLQYCQAVKSEN